MRLLVTGGAGFIGSHFVELALERGHEVLVLDLLTYAGHIASIASVQSKLIDFVKADICDGARVGRLLQDAKIDGLIHFAAESHVDRSITGPDAFIRTNIEGTYQLLQAARHYSESTQHQSFRYLQVSTDEVFGQLGETGYFSETTAYSPNSPYSASKAAADHLVMAWHHTFHLQTVITHCSNNYGPRQMPEKLIPHMITQALKGKKLPVYGKGTNVRDWIYVRDHARGILAAFERGTSGQRYCFGGNAERNNLEVVQTICTILDRLQPRADGQSYRQEIEFVTDRLGHDFRYAIDDSLARKELGFEREMQQFEPGLESTVRWYLENPDWIAHVTRRT